MIEKIMASPITEDNKSVQSVKKRNYVSMHGNDLERTGEGDSFQSKNKTKKTLGITAGLVSFAAIILGAVCFHKGGKVLEGKNASFKERLEAGWKKLCGKDVKIKPEDKPKTGETAKPEEKPTDTKPKTEETPKTNKVDETQKAAEKQTEKVTEPKANEVKLTDKQKLELLSGKKVADCTPEEIKQFADLTYKDADVSRLLQKCLQTENFKKSSESLENTHAVIKDFVDVMSQYMPKKYLTTDVLYKPINELKVSEVMLDEHLELMRNLEKTLCESMDISKDEIFGVDKLKDMNFIECFKQSKENASNVFNEEFLNMLDLDITKSDVKKSILEMKLDSYMKLTA